MKMSTQVVIAVVLVVVFAIVGAIIVTGGKMDIPGISQNMVEVTVEVERPFFSGAVPDTVKIVDTKLYRGVPLEAIGPLFFEVDWVVRVRATAGGAVLGTASKPITIGWWQKVTVILDVPLGDRTTGVTLRADVLDKNGLVVLTDTITI